MSMTRLLLLPFALAFWGAPAKAQDSEAQTLTRRVEQLERRVAELERRLQAFEASPQPARLDATRPAPGDWKQLGNWRRLRQGMTMDDVKTLLGQPDRVEVVGFARFESGAALFSTSLLRADIAKKRDVLGRAKV